jgi:hypothetical protein
VNPGIMAIRNLLWGATVVALVCMLSVAEGSHVNLGTTVHNSAQPRYICFLFHFSVLYLGFEDRRVFFM